LAWPDHGVPDNAISMVNFIKRVRKTHPYSKQDLLLVHCSAGVGRTGTFITLDSMLERIKAKAGINIFEFVSNLRKQRVLMVQTQVPINLT
jgi:netrin-G3 ligand